MKIKSTKGFNFIYIFVISFALKILLAFWHTVFFLELMGQNGANGLYSYNVMSYYDEISVQMLVKKKFIVRDSFCKIAMRQHVGENDSLLSQLFSKW